MTNVICIGRRYGAAGINIGQEVAEKLGYEFYDDDLLDKAAEYGNFDAETAKQYDEKAKKSLLFSIAGGTYAMKGMVGGMGYTMPLNDKLFISQSEIIRRAAAQNNCVIVGRCADYVLSKAKDVNVIRVFVYAPLEFRAKRVADRFGLTMKQAKDKIVKTEKQRRTYYNFYTNRNWGEMENYDLCINSEKVGIENSAQVIIDYIKGTGNA